MADFSQLKRRVMKNTSPAVAVGAILVEFVIHRMNCSLREISDYTGPYPGVAPAIFLDQAARLGALTEMIGSIGSDGFGLAVMARLEADGLGTRGVTVTPERNTCFIPSTSDLGFLFPDLSEDAAIDQL